jgi:hypothetical protein
MALSAEDALSALQEILANSTDGKATQVQLRELASLVATDAPGSVTVLYSGGDATRIAEVLAKTNPDLRLLDNTQAYKFLNSPQFLKAIEDCFGSNPTERGTLANNFLSGAEGVWGDASTRFARSATGEVRLILDGADPARVFGMREIPELLRNPLVTTVEGFSVKELAALYAKDSKYVFEALSGITSLHMAATDLRLVMVNGQATVLNAAEFLSREILDTSDYFSKYPERLVVYEQYLTTLTKEELALRGTLATRLAQISAAVTHELGVIHAAHTVSEGAFFLSLLFAAKQAKDELDAGKVESAQSKI